jgi:hypothetical protein
VASSAVNQLGERAELGWAVAWVAHQIQASPDLASGVIDRNGETVGSYEYTPQAPT